MWQASPYYPDPAFQALDPSFNRYFETLGALERLATGFRWCEGPVWFGDANCLLWSDIPNDKIMRYDQGTGAVSVFRQPANMANGNTRDRQGRLVTCEHSGRRVTRTEYDGTITVLADRYDGKRLNSPNDLVVCSDDSIWFTDPPFGIGSDYMGRRGQQELPASVYRLDPSTGVLALMVSDIAGPNGLAFSPDEKTLYLVDCRSKPDRILAYDLIDSGLRLSAPKTLIEASDGGTPDGFRCDEDGNLWCGWGMNGGDLDGVMIFSPAGKPLGRIALPERCANLCFGGPYRNRLFMASSQSLYAVYVNTRGAVAC
ncbi:SMP-30/gluconolactonase/LRE family protein [uncultured Devosia sp.]|uniref:SMP-30/gluconolactonase/LRE family protein n=1 Tax=uncultured Devosia sp. TaxID=211434 RepID=UPI0035CABA82